MHNRLKNILVKGLQGTVEYLMVFPVFFLIGAYFVPTNFLWYWVAGFIPLFLIGLLFSSFSAGGRRWVYMLFALSISSLCAFGLNLSTITSIITFTLQFVVVYRGIMYGRGQWHQLLPSSLLWSIGLPVYFLGFFLFRYNDLLSVYYNLFTWAGMVFLVIVLFVSNNDHLQSAMLSKEKRPVIQSSLKVHNRIFLSITILIIVVITNFQVIQTTLYNVVGGILRGIINFFSQFNGEPIEEEPPEAPAQQQMPLEEPKESSAIAEFFDKVLMVFSFILIILAIIFLLYVLMKRLPLIARKFSQFIRLLLQRVTGKKQQQETNDIFTDEKENLIDWNKWKDKSKEKAKEILSSIVKRPVKWDSLTEQEKVRYIYREVIDKQKEKGYKVKPNDTPHEVISELERLHGQSKPFHKLDEMYNKVRYGKEKENQNISAEELSSFLGR